MENNGTEEIGWVTPSQVIQSIIENDSPFVQVLACHQFNTKPLPEPKLSVNGREQTSEMFQSN